MKYKYAIVDIINGFQFVKSFDNEDVARSEIYKLRKAKYIADYPERPAYEYDLMKHDNGFNLIKYTIIA